MSATDRRMLPRIVIGLVWQGILFGIAVTAAQAQSRGNLRQKTYDVSRIVPSGHIDSLVEVIRGTVYPTGWDTAGGPGTIRAKDKHTLEVSQSDEVHGELAGLLAALGKLPALQRPAPGKAKPQPARIPVPKRAGADDGIVVYSVEDLVGKKGRPDFDSLMNVITQTVDSMSWCSAGGPGVVEPFVEGRAIVVLQSDAVQGELAELLAALGKLPALQKPASGKAKPQPLQIPLTKQAGARQIIVVYAVQDLVETAGGLNFNSLIESMTANVAPDTWDSGGGEGKVVPFAPGKAIVVVQSKEAHEQVAKLLERLRKRPRGAGLGSKPEKGVRTIFALPLRLPLAATQGYRRWKIVLTPFSTPLVSPVPAPGRRPARTASAAAGGVGHAHEYNTSPPYQKREAAALVGRFRRRRVATATGIRDRLNTKAL